MRRAFAPLLLGLILGLGSMGLSAQRITVVKPGEDLDPKDGKAALLVDKATKAIEEKSLIFDGHLHAMAEPGGDRPNGCRMYCFNLDPKETIHFILTSESANHVGMYIIRPTKQDAMVGEFERIKRIAKSLRSSNFHIQNVTGEPYQIILMVYGSVNYAYKLQIERS
jgi:hypothetical protein